MPNACYSGVPLQDGEQRQHVITATSRLLIDGKSWGFSSALGWGACLPEVEGVVTITFLFLLGILCDENVDLLRGVTLVFCAIVGYTCLV